MLLLFITFLFINAEVWQVSSSLDGGILWGTVLFFGVAALLFLVPRLADELDAFDDSIVAADLMAASKGTPLESAAQRLVDDDIDLPEEAQVTGLQMVNLVLVLVIAQAVQVLLLAIAVFAFFIVFGAVAIDDGVIESWTGEQVIHVFDLDLVSERAAPGLGVPRGVLRPLLHRLRDHRRALPQGVLHGDHERAPPGRGRARRLPGSPARAATGARIRSTVARRATRPPQPGRRCVPSTVRRSLVRSGRPSHQGCQHGSSHPRCDDPSAPPSGAGGARGSKPGRCDLADADLCAGPLSRRGTCPGRGAAMADDRPALVWRTHNGPLTSTARHWVAVLEAGPRAMVDGESSLVLAGLERFTVDEDPGLCAARRADSPPGVAAQYPADSTTDAHRSSAGARGPSHPERHRGHPGRAVGQIGPTSHAADSRWPSSKASPPRARSVSSCSGSGATVAERWSTRLSLELAGGIRSLNELDVLRGCRERGIPEPDRQSVRRTSAGSYYLDFRGRGGGWRSRSTGSSMPGRNSSSATRCGTTRSR